MDLVKKFLFFDSFITPRIITFIYWLACIGCILSGIVAMFSTNPYTGQSTFLYGLAILIGGPLYFRLMFEIVMVVFKINGNLQKIADREN